MSSLKAFLFVVLVLGAVSASNAQPYQPMLGDTNQWFVYHWFEGGWTEIFTSSGDNYISNGIAYKTVTKTFSNDLSEERIMVLREDTLERKIYGLACNNSHCNSTEIILYDFSKSPGDTVLFQNMDGDSQLLVLDSISVDSSISVNRMFYMHTFGYMGMPYGPIIWIEGAGSAAGIDCNICTSNPSDGILLCAFKDLWQTYENYDIHHPGDCIIDWIGSIGEINASYINIAPNPIDDVVKLTTTKPTLFLKEINLLNITGQISISQSCTAQPQSITLNTQTLSGGIYLCHITFSNGQTVVKKVVKL